MQMQSAETVNAAIAIHKEAANALQSVFDGAPPAIDFDRTGATEFLNHREAALRFWKLLGPAITAEGRALKTLADVAETSDADVAELKGYVAELKGRTLWGEGQFDPGANLIDRLATTVGLLAH